MTTHYVHIDVSLNFINNATVPRTGHVQFMYAPRTSSSRLVQVDADGNIYVGNVPNADKVRITFHALTKKLTSKDGTYEMRFRPGNKAEELLWISNDKYKPNGEWTGGAEFSDFKYNVDELDSNISVTMDKKLLPNGWSERAFDLGMEALRITGTPAPGLVRSDPQIRNGSPPGEGRTHLVLVAAIVLLILGAALYFFR